jgi:hypothetical protein
VTLSLHHFEDDEMLGGYMHNEWVPSVRVDPDLLPIFTLCAKTRRPATPWRRRALRPSSP